MISAVVLAAGPAPIMGEQKLFLPFKGKPVLQWVLETALASDLHEVICIVRDLRAVRQRIRLVHERLMWLVNHAADRGQSTSLIAGLWATHPNSQGTLFLVGDQPMIGSNLIDSLIRRFRSSPALIVAPKFAGQVRNPALFRRELFPELLTLTGDQNGRMLMDKYSDKSELLEWHEEEPFMDLDVPADYERLNKLA
jgi:molybdenum cofactor cytidylyltransferase